MNFLLWGRPRSGLLSLTSSEIIDEIEERLEYLVEHRIEHVYNQTKSMVEVDLTKNKDN